MNRFVIFWGFGVSKNAKILQNDFVWRVCLWERIIWLMSIGKRLIEKKTGMSWAEFRAQVDAGNNPMQKGGHYALEKGKRVNQKPGKSNTLG